MKTPDTSNVELATNPMRTSKQLPAITRAIMFDSTSDERTPYVGPWLKTLQILVQLSESCDNANDLPAGAKAGMKSRRAASGSHNSSRLLAITGHQYRGFWRIICTEDDGKSILCSVPKYSTQGWIPNFYDVVAPNRSKNDNVCVTEPIADSVTTRLEALAWIAPPLTFHTRMTVFSVDDIDTVRQTFRANLFLEMRLRGLSAFDDRELIRHVLRAYDFDAAMVEVLNVVDQISVPERWESFGTNHIDDEVFDYCFKVRYHSVIAEEFELQNFPFDRQDLTVTATLNIPSSQARLVLNQEFPSIFCVKDFKQTSVFQVTYSHHVHSRLHFSDKIESSAGFIYPRVDFVVNLARYSGFYITNIAVPMFVITALTSVSIGVQESDRSRLTTGDRLQITVTLLLTAVAYKFVVAESLPNVSYQTTMDNYIHLCNFWVILAALENILYPVLAFDSSGHELFNEWYVLVIFLSSFLAMNFVFWYKVLSVVKVERDRAQELFAANEAARSASLNAAQGDSRLEIRRFSSLMSAPLWPSPPNHGNSV